MQRQSCPNCTAVAPQFLESASATSWVSYFRCEICGHVWHVPKNDESASPTTVVLGTAEYRKRPTRLPAA